MNTKILLAEDDPGLGFVIKDNLTYRKYDVTLCVNGEDAQEKFFERTFDLCILDVMLPKIDGFSLARTIRSKDKNIPILFVTAKNLMNDKIEGFESGGDDYIVKPFSMEELNLRIEVFLRRTKGNLLQSSYSIGSYIFDCPKMTLTHEKSIKSLTQKEAEVLTLLCRNKDQVIKRDEILKSIWGDDDYFKGRSLDVFISKLRKYLSHDSAVQIVNYHGVGFRLEIS